MNNKTFSKKRRMASYLAGAYLIGIGIVTIGSTSSLQRTSTLLQSPKELSTLTDSQTSGENSTAVENFAKENVASKNLEQISEEEILRINLKLKNSGKKLERDNQDPNSFYLIEYTPKTEKPGKKPTPNLAHNYSEKNSTPVIPYTNDEVHLLAKAITGEMRGANKPAMTAVGYSAINRVLRKGWPKRLSKVIRQPYQYHAVTVPSDPNYRLVNSSPTRYNPVDRTAFNDAYNLAKKILVGEIPDPTYGATSYRTGTKKRVEEIRYNIEREKGKHTENGLPRVTIIATGKKPKSGDPYAVFWVD